MTASAQQHRAPARRLAIIGATGTVGSELLAQALAAGHEVRALVRSPTRLRTDGPHLSVVQGDVKDPEAVGVTVRGCDALISALGATRGDDADTRRTGTSNLISAMREEGIVRLVVMGGFHVHCAGEDMNVGQRLVIPFLRLSGIVVADTTGMAELVLASGLDWTLVRSPRVVHRETAAPPRIGALKLGPWSKATRGDLARLMLDCATKDTYLRQAPMMASR